MVYTLSDIPNLFTERTLKSRKGRSIGVYYGSHTNFKFSKINEYESKFHYDTYENPFVRYGFSIPGTARPVPIHSTKGYIFFYIPFTYSSHFGGCDFGYYYVKLRTQHSDGSHSMLYFDSRESSDYYTASFMALMTTYLKSIHNKNYLVGRSTYKYNAMQGVVFGAQTLRSYRFPRLLATYPLSYFQHIYPRLSPFIDSLSFYSSIDSQGRRYCFAGRRDSNIFIVFKSDIFNNISFVYVYCTEYYFNYFSSNGDFPPSYTEPTCLFDDFSEYDNLT